LITIVTEVRERMQRRGYRSQKRNIGVLKIPVFCREGLVNHPTLESGNPGQNGFQADGFQAGTWELEGLVVVHHAVLKLLNPTGDLMDVRERLGRQIGASRIHAGKHGIAEACQASPWLPARGERLLITSPG
jgi:hypothetical protein